MPSAYSLRASTVRATSHLPSARLVAVTDLVFTSYRVIFSNRSVIRACLSAGASARMAATRSSERG
ncbi:hypothetical protein D9M72_609630 [compost metagenome]